MGSDFIKIWLVNKERNMERERKGGRSQAEASKPPRRRLGIGVEG